MDNGENKLPRDAAPKVQEDMVELIQKFKIPKFNYVDVPKLERMSEILVRWPLLEELSKNVVNN